MTLLERAPDLVLAGVNDKLNVAEDIAYSGTMAIAREATFWEVPAIAFPRARSPAASDAAAIGKLLRVLWDGRAQWQREGNWLSLNLPAPLPAPLVQASVRRDKIGAACEILVTRETERIVYRRSRPPGHVQPGDERAALAAGAIAVVRYAGPLAPLPDEIPNHGRRLLESRMPSRRY